MSTDTKDVTIVRAVERALDIMKCFTNDEVELYLGEISDKVNLPKSTVHRLLNTLENSNFIEQSSNGKYRLSFEVIRLGVIASENIDLKRLANPDMKTLSEKCGQTSNLYMIQGYQRLCIAQVEGPQYVKRYSYLGALLPLYAGASGKVLLAYKSDDWLNRFFENVDLIKLTEKTIIDKDKIIEELQVIRSQGYGFSSTERDPVSSSISAPIFNYAGEMIAVLTVSGPSVMFNKDNFETYLPLLLKASRKISNRLGYNSDISFT